jgi:Barstar (barnase inhibitor)
LELLDRRPPQTAFYGVANLSALPAALDQAGADPRVVDWRLLQNGFVHMYWRNQILDDTVEWLKQAGYQVTTRDASTWDSDEAFHAVIAAAFGFPDDYGKNMKALNDCLGEVARCAYGADPGATGTALVVRTTTRSLRSTERWQRPSPISLRNRPESVRC